MSRVGKKPIEIPEKVNVSLADGVLTAKGPAGELKMDIPKRIKVDIKDKEINVSVAKPEEKFEKSLWGTYGSLITNLVAGANEPFKKELEINGVGYGFELSGQKLVVKAGYSHPIEKELPKEVKGKVEKNVLVLESADKQVLGQIAAEIRAIRKPEPYKGKGIKYIDEQIIRKVGKQVSGSEG
ncbi:50S ribosomal protein L6 [Patescibacteria group bacterium]|nr:50S ribosomal protein L6 [Patescibacteria group bacterium]MBU1673659.1 50S ribosomal protein L6 [Patescibacteria group bacterium]MBU1963853.1 50S ribosomal protein L6 [Patescibacteria group bacterium]